MSTSRVGRSYTRARRHPWVIGKIGTWTLPLGPFTPIQLVIAFVGAFALIKTFTLWRPLGPLPLIALGLATWAVRAVRISGRAPLAALLGLALAVCEPRAGRIGGRIARTRRAHWVHGRYAVITTGILTDPAATSRPGGDRARPAPTPIQTLLARGGA